MSFVAIGLFFATIGFSLGLDSGVLREASAVVLVLIGVVLAIPPLQARLALAAGPVAQWTDARFGGVSRQGFWGQLGVGLLLGAVWSPCVGPTLGAASALAAEGRDLGQVGATMLVFGIGAALPLLLLGLVSRAIRTGRRPNLSASTPKTNAPRGRIANVRVIASVTLLIVTPKSAAIYFKTKTRMKKSNASSVHPR